MMKEEPDIWANALQCDKCSQFTCAFMVKGAEWMLENAPNWACAMQRT